jgi:hypothetical protein
MKSKSILTPKQKQIFSEPVDESIIPRGKWSNVTRNQIVEVQEVKMSSELQVKVVEYYWKDCPFGRYYYFKPLTQFLRSYEAK